MEHNFIGYGSLISHKSLKSSIKDRKFKPVIVKGFRRVFNLKIKGSDFLNLIKDKKGSFNGVLFKVTESELVKLKEREDDYNLEEADVYDFKTQKKIGRGFLVIDYVVGIDKKKTKPNKEYLKLCREAAYHISEEFGEFWDKTTYTSEGKKISENTKLLK